MNQAVKLLLLLALFGAALGQQDLDCGDSVIQRFENSDQSYVLLWCIRPATNDVQMTMSARTSGWVGVGWSDDPTSAHNNGDFIVGWVDSAGVLTIWDRISRAHALVPVDAVQNINETFGTELDGWTNVTFTRLLSTGDLEEDVAISDRFVTFAWAWHTQDGNGEGFAQHTIMGAMRLNFITGAREELPTTAAPTPAPTVATTAAPTSVPGQVPVPTEQPSGLSGTRLFLPSINPNYRLSWSIIDINGAPGIQFTMSARTDGYVAVGWSRSVNAHDRADYAVGWILNGQPVLYDRWLGNGPLFIQPTLDATQNLQLISGGQSNGWTTITFSKLLNTGDATQDVAITDSGMTLLWSYGPLTNGGASPGDFTYHGSDNRGIERSMNFITETVRTIMPSPDYILKIENIFFNDGLGTPGLRIEMSARTTGWVGVGWTDAEVSHSNTDMIVGWVDDATGVVTVWDRFSNEPGNVPADSEQDISDIVGFQANGWTTISFRRRLDTGNANDVALRDATQLFAWAYANTDGDGVAFQQHDVRGSRSLNFVNGPSDPANTPSPTSATIAPTAAPVATTIAPTSAPVATPAPTTIAPTTVAPTTVAPTLAPTTRPPVPEPTELPSGLSGNRLFLSSTGTYRLSWSLITVDGAPGIQMTMSARTTGWVGVGWTTSVNGHQNADIVVGWVTGTQTTIYDRWVSAAGGQPRFVQPENDATQNVQLVSGSESNGWTTITFRRRLNTGDATNDLAITDTGLTLLWAWGQNDGTDVNAWTRHEENGKQPGTNFITETIRTIHPSDDYVLKIENVFLADGLGTPGVRIEMSARTTGWVGVGWTDATTAHTQTDMIVGWVNDVTGVVTLWDRYSNMFAVVPEDVQQDLTDVVGYQADGWTTISFRRRLDTGNVDDVPLRDAFQLFAWAYADADGNGAAFRQHTVRGSQLLNFVRDVAAPTTTPPPTEGAVPELVRPADSELRTFQTPTGDYVLTWFVGATPSGAPAIQFTMSARAAGWVGVGWTTAARAHTATDMIVGWVSNGQAFLFDRYSDAFGVVPVDETRNVMLVRGVEANGWTNITFIKPLQNTDTVADVEIPEAELLFSWAYHATTDGQPNGGFMQHTERGSQRLSFLSTQDPFEETEPVLGVVRTQNSADNRWRMSWQLVRLTTGGIGMQVVMEANTTGWVGVGWTRSTRNSHSSTDNIVGYVIDGRVIVWDRWSSDFGVVPPDESQDVLDVSGSEIDGVTRINFTRPLISPDSATDHSIGDETFRWAWAWGVLDGDPVTPLFLQHPGEGRGSGLINWVGRTASTAPARTFTSADGSYTMSWEIVFMQNAQIGIEIVMSAKTTGWVGIGWTEGRISHDNGEMIVGWVIDGVTTLWDRWSPELGAVPPDSVQNVQLISGTEVNGTTTISFRRPLVTGDLARDVDIVSGRPLLFSWAYGAADGVGSTPAFLQHSNTARDSARIDFVRGIIQPRTVTPPTTTAPPPATTGLGAFSSPSGDYSLVWRIDTAAEAIEWTVEAATTGWVGIGWTNGLRAHVQSDMIVAWVDSAGMGHVIDCWSANSNSRPPVDPTDPTSVSVVSASESNGMTRVTLRRRLDTADSNDLAVIDASVLFQYSYGADGDDVILPAAQFNQHVSRGMAMLNWVAGGGATAIQEPLDAAFVYTGVIIIIGLIYSFFHLFHKFWKALYALRHYEDNEGGQFFTNHVDDNIPLIEVNGSKKALMTGDALKEAGGSEEDADAIDEAHKPADFNKFYRGSISVKYAGSPGEVKVEGGLAGTTTGGYTELTELKSPKTGGFFGFGSRKKSNVEPFLQYSEKKAKNVATNAFYRLWRKRVPHFQFAVMDVVTFAIFVFINIGFLVIWGNPLWNPYVTLGYLAVANAFFVALPATRNSVMTWFLGLAFDKTILYHRWIGRLIFILVSIHFFSYIDEWRKLGTVKENYMIDKYRYGTTAWAFLTVVVITSLGYFRRKQFNFFYTTHFLFIGFYVFGCLHAPEMQPYTWAALFFYLLDRAMRLFFGSYFQVTTKLQVLPGNLVRVKFRKNPYARYAIGQYVFVNFPQLSLLEWHPFTLASGPREKELEIDIRSLGDHTKAIHDKARGQQNMVIRVDGPYGRWPFNYARYKKCLFVAGGVGVTPCIAALRHIYRLNRPEGEPFTPEPIVKVVYFAWACSSEEVFNWFKDVLEECWRRADTPDHPKLKAFIYISRSDEVTDARLIPGRLDLSNVFNEMQQDEVEASRVSVVACGPSLMVDETWDHCVGRTGKSARFDFHHETFDF